MVRLILDLFLVMLKHLKMLIYLIQPQLARGTQQSTVDVTVPQIGRAKSRGFELNNGTASANTFSSSTLTSAVYKHFLFDVEMFTHLNVKTAPAI
jgi:hypothetical protein